MSAPEAAPLVLHPAPLGDGSSSRCEIYVDRVAPLNTSVAAPPGTDADLVEWIDLLRTYPVNRAAVELNRRRAAQTVPLPTVDLTPRHRAPDVLPPAPVQRAEPQRPEPESQPEMESEPLDPAAGEVLTNTDDFEALDGEDLYIHLPKEDDDYTLDKKGRRHFHHWASEGAGYAAVDADMDFFTDESGHFVWTNNKGVETQSANPKDLLSKLTNFIKSGGTSTEPLSDEVPEMYDENGVPIEHFEIPTIGRPVGVVSEKSLGNRRLIFTVCATGLVGVIGLLAGVIWGRGAVPASGAISPEEAQIYRLSSLPVGAMSAFGEQYLETCLTHGDRNQMKARAALLAQMSTGGATPGCGWTEGGEQQTPLSIGFTGRWKPIEGVFGSGRGVYLDYLVSTRAGQFSTYTVPVWIKSDSTSNDMSVVGDIGNIPGMQVVTPDNYEPNLATDSTLASSLQTNLIEPYLTAWAASDHTQIDLAISADATQNAKRGLRRTVKNPEIVTTLAYSSVAGGDGRPGDYTNGDTALVVVTVTWTIPASADGLPDSTQTSGYRINVTRTGDKWVVSDINGGAVTSRAASKNQSGTGDDSSQEPGIAGITPGATGGPVNESDQTPTSSVDNQLAPTSVAP